MLPQISKLYFNILDGITLKYLMDQILIRRWLEENDVEALCLPLSFQKEAIFTSVSIVTILSQALDLKFWFHQV